MVIALGSEKLNQGAIDMSDFSLVRNSSAAWLLATGLAAAIPVVGEASGSESLEEILVSARKRDENLLEVPLSMSVLGAKELEERQITTFADLANSTPGLYFESFTSGTVSTPTIRGLSQQNLGGFDQQVSNNVGSFIDGVYQTNRNALVLDLLDIERVEVIKGPASALYGRATFSGAINVVTREPAEEPGGQLRVGTGSDDDFNAQGSFGGLIGASGIRGRIAAGYHSFDGTIRNVEDPGDNLQGFRNVGVTGNLLIPFGERVDLALSTFYVEQNVEHSGQYLQTTLNCGTTPAGFTYFCGEAKYREPVAISPQAFGARTESWQSVAKLTTHFDGFDVLAIGAYTQSESDVLLDADYTMGGALHPVCVGMVGPVPCFFSPAAVITRYQAASGFNGSTNSNDDLSIELRVQSTGSERLTWLGGLYYFDSQHAVDNYYGVDNTGLAPGEFFATAIGGLTGRADPIGNPAVVSDFESDVRTMAVFGSLEFAFTDRLRAGIEGRFEREEKDFNSIINFFAPGAGAVSDEWDAFTPRVTVDYDVADRALLYLTAAKGARAGGFNAVYPASRPEESRYDSESNWTYELGAKTQQLDGKLVLTGAVFYIDWENMQLTGASSDPAFAQSLISNAGGATSRGFEVSGRIAPLSGLTFGASYAFADPKFDDGVIDRGASFQCAPDICTLTPRGPDVGGNQLPRTIKHQAMFDIAYTGHLAGDWSWDGRVDFTWADDASRDSIHLLTYGERSLLGAYLAVRRDDLTVALWGKNLLDDEYVTNAAFQPRSFTSRAVDYNQSDGRRYGLMVSYDF